MLSLAAAFMLVDVCTMLLFASVVEPKCTPNWNVGSSAFQIIGESTPSLLRSEPEWSLTAMRPPPSCTNARIAEASAAVKDVLGSGTMSTSKFERSSGLLALPYVNAVVLVVTVKPRFTRSTPHDEIAPVQ